MRLELLSKLKKYLKYRHKREKKDNLILKADMYAIKAEKNMEAYQNEYGINGSIDRYFDLFEKYFIRTKRHLNLKWKHGDI